MTDSNLFGRRHYEHLARLCRRTIARMYEIHGTDPDAATHVDETIACFANELENAAPSFHKELFLHNVHCFDTHPFGAEQCPFVDRTELLIDHTYDLP